MQQSLPLPYCQLHQQPLNYVSLAPESNCPIRLCQSCLPSQNSKDYLKWTNFVQKIEMETDIITKQYAFVEDHPPKPTPPSTKQP